MPARRETVRDVVLVHGAFVDGSGWQGVYAHLSAAGYRVTNAQIATQSLADDVTATRRAIAAHDGPVILVGHSYGGVVITEAGTAPNVAGLVYVSAFAPDAGESVASLSKEPAPGAAAPPIRPVEGGLVVERAHFKAAFAADLDDDIAAFMADSQPPWGLEAFAGTVTAPAWKTKPSWYLVATEDRMIPPDAQRSMSRRARSTVVEVTGSHAVYVSQARAVADLIETAGEGALINGTAGTAGGRG